MDRGVKDNTVLHSSIASGYNKKIFNCCIQILTLVT